MRESINFSFDGIASEEMGVYLVHESGGLFEENFLPTRSIIEKKVANNFKPYFQRLELEPLEFPLNIYLGEWKERDNNRQIARWLFQDYYKPLIFETNPDRIFYAMFVGDSSLLHNGKKDGYIRLNVRCNSPYSYSHPNSYENIQSDNDAYTIYNSGDIEIKPKLWIKKNGSEGDVSITIKETNQTLSVKNLKANEEVFIDCEHEDIISDMEHLNIYRHGDHNDEFLIIEPGTNTLEMNGDFTLSVEYQSVYLAD